jgi:acetyl-CoA acetyltransferase
MIGAVITGIGMSKLGRNLNRAPMDLLLDAALEAMTDTGLTRDDIDGITTYPGRAAGSPGISPLNVGDLRNALALKTRWHSATSEGAAAAGTWENTDLKGADVDVLKTYDGYGIFVPLWLAVGMGSGPLSNAMLVVRH